MNNSKMNPVVLSLIIITFINLIECDDNVPYWSEMRHLLRAQEIGQIKSRIVNGVEATLSDAPFKVSIVRSDGSHWCGGALISPRTVLTAAHCINDGLIGAKIKYGGLNNENLPGTSFISNVIKHPSYIRRVEGTRSFIDADIGVIHLKDPVVETSYVKIIEVAHTTPRPGTQAMIYGWGHTLVEIPEYPDYQPAPETGNILQKTTLRIMRKEECVFKNGHFFCARNPNTSACIGDSGGPVVANNKVIGVLSSVVGTLTCKKGLPLSCTSAVFYRRWIIANTIK